MVDHQELQTRLMRLTQAKMTIQRNIEALEGQLRNHREELLRVDGAMQLAASLEEYSAAEELEAKANQDELAKMESDGDEEAVCGYCGPETSDAP